MPRPAIRALAVVTLLAVFATACGEDDASLAVTDAWARASASMQNAGAVYMTITGGDADTALVGVSVPPSVASMAMLHETSMGSDGAMSMSPAMSIEIPAGATVMLEPGGYHVMAMPLAGALFVGDTFDVTLTFDNGTVLTVQAEVREG